MRDDELRTAGPQGERIFLATGTLRELLKEARDTLGEYKFSSNGEYNNYDVIDLCEKIDAFLSPPRLQQGKQIQVVRTLLYEGDEEWIKHTLAVGATTRLSNLITPKGYIKEQSCRAISEEEDSCER